MTECGVCIGGGDYDGSYEFQSEAIRRAKKQHKCYECHRPIRPGQQYHYFSGKWEGEMDSYHTCLDCHNIREGLSCDGQWPPFGNLWCDIRENFKDLRSTSCLTKIPTASAKAYFLERWRLWKGISDLANNSAHP